MTKEERYSGFIPNFLEEELAPIAKFGSVNIGNVIGVLHAIVDAGLSDSDLTPPNSKTGKQYEKDRKILAQYIMMKIQPYYKGELAGNRSYSVISTMIDKQVRLKINLIKMFTPYKKKLKRIRH
jgi:hypothetical protein